MNNTLANTDQDVPGPSTESSPLSSPPSPAASPLASAFSPLLNSPLLKLVFIGLATELIYVIYIVAFPLISNTQKGGPAADLEILMRGDRWFAPLYVVGLLLLYYLFWQAVKIVSSVKCQVSGEEESSSNKEYKVRETFSPLSSLLSPLSSVKLMILAFGLLFGFTLVWLYPITANDLFRYVLRARIWAVYGASPMLAPPDAFPKDPYLPFAGEFGAWVSGYGPLWELMAQVPVRLLGATEMVGGSVSLKILVLLCYLACAVLLGWFVKPHVTLGSGNASVTVLVFFAWNPLVLMQVMGNGHNDMVLMLFLVLGIAWWQRGHWWATTLALALAVAAKAPALLVIPLFVVALAREQAAWRQRIPKLLGAGAIGLVVIYLCYAPLGPLNQIFQDVWNTITKGLGPVLAASNTLNTAWAWLTTQLGFAPLSSNTPPGLGAMLTTRRGFAIASAVRMTLREITPWDVAETLPRTTARYIFFGFYAWTLVQVWRKKLNFVTAGFLVYFYELMFGATFRIWYPLWLIPLAALYLTPATFGRTVLFSLAAELSIVNYFVVWRWWLQYWPWDKLHLSNNLYYWTVMHLLTVPWLFGLPLFGPLFVRWWTGRNRPKFSS